MKTDTTSLKSGVSRTKTSMHKRLITRAGRINSFKNSRMKFNERLHFGNLENKYSANLHFVWFLTSQIVSERLVEFWAILTNSMILHFSENDLFFA